MHPLVAARALCGLQRVYIKAEQRAAGDIGGEITGAEERSQKAALRVALVADHGSEAASTLPTLG